jgi:hypothetical protein
MNYSMKLNGYTAKIMEAERLVGDHSFDLPPGTPLPVYKVSDFMKKPDHWMDDDGCFVVPVNPDKGLWFDWTDNDARNVCVLPSVKGCNPITGQQLDDMALESYEKKCPVHGTEFGENLFCEKCGYSWAPQNYVTGASTLWLDGFRDKDGTVRQFFFTEDMKRDVASAMLGKENTVPAFGFAFYKAKEKRMSVIYNSDTGTFEPLIKSNTNKDIYYDNYMFNMIDCSLSISKSANSNSLIQEWKPVYDGGGSDDSRCRGITNIANVRSDCLSVDNSFADSGPDIDTIAFTGIDENIEEKEVAVGAGAQIKQDIKKDEYGIDTWSDLPDAVMRIYFVFEDEFKQWEAHGMKNNHSMLNGMPVG